MAGVQVYKSTDASAPVLTATAGDFINLLDKCLVSGYGAKPAAGWTKPFTGVNKAVFKAGSPSAGVPPIQYYLDVDDAAPNATALGAEANVAGFETMSAVNTGTNRFPPAGTLTCMRKAIANGNGAVAVPWMVFADETTFYFFYQPSASQWRGMTFGEIYSFVAADQYKFALIGRPVNSTLGGLLVSINAAGAPTSIAEHRVARAFNGGQIGSFFGKCMHFFGSANASGTNSYKYPDPLTGGLLLSPFYTVDSANAADFSVRGRLRGVWATPHAGTNFTDGDTLNGTGALAGRSFLAVRSDDVANSVIFVETSNTWDRSV